jgi:hypothetical protein
MSENRTQEGWHLRYPEEPRFTREQVAQTLGNFLAYAGYRVEPPQAAGFMMPDLTAIRVCPDRRYEMLFVIREGINQAVAGFRELAAARCFRKDAPDYVLALPPVSEHHLIEFLTEKEDWYFPIKDQMFQLWLVNPERDKVDCLIGWPRDDDFRHYFATPTLAGFSGYIANKAARKIMSEEFE